MNPKRVQGSYTKKGFILGYKALQANFRYVSSWPYRLPQDQPTVSVVVPFSELTIAVFTLGILKGNPPEGPTMETLCKPHKPWPKP